MGLLHLIKAASIGAAGVLTIALLSGAAFERVSRERADRQFKAPGRVVLVDGRKVQIDCRGSGSPTVVFESGLDTYGSLAWSAVHDSIARTTRACAYSRAGIMWSESNGDSFDADTAARILHEALTAVGVSSPMVLVAHSLGGPYAAVYTARYPDDVAGLVMVDASHPDQFARFTQAVGKPLMPTPMETRIGAALAWTGIVRLAGKSPVPPTWPKELGVVPPAFLPHSVGGLAHEVEAIPATLARVGASRSFGDRPLVVLFANEVKSAAELKMLGVTAEQGRQVTDIRRELAGDMATWSTRGRLEVIEGSSHYIQLDRPDVVIAAVKEVVGYVIAHDSTPRRR